MWMRLVIGGAIGLVAGGLLGYLSRRHSGAGLLAGLSYSGAIFGALFGVVVVAAFFRPPVAKTHGATKEQFAAAIVKTDQPVFAEFYADWCPACRKLAPTIEKVAVEFAGRARVLRINVDDRPGLVRRYDVRSIPAIIIFVRGKVFRQLGPASLKTYRKALAAAIAVLKNGKPKEQ